MHFKEVNKEFLFYFFLIEKFTFGTAKLGYDPRFRYYNLKRELPIYLKSGFMEKPNVHNKTRTTANFLAERRVNRVLMRKMEYNYSINYLQDHY